VFGKAQNMEYETLVNTLLEKVEALESRNNGLNNELRNLKTAISALEYKVDSLQKQTTNNTLAINRTAEELGVKITTTETATNQRFAAVDKSMSKKTLYGIIGVLIAVIVFGVLYWLLRKKQSSIEESLVKELGKQAELAEEQLELIKQQQVAAQKTPDAEIDHSLALKLSSEIVLMERNMHMMDSGTKGLKQLNRSIGKLKDNLAANGYEIPELLGKQFHEGMKVIVVNSIPDETLDKGSEIITKILVPQVNYNDKMVQTAQIEVSVGV
jgi:predicted RNase H-like nuclease (RuvC/YqgF family)